MKDDDDDDDDDDDYNDDDIFSFPIYILNTTIVTPARWMMTWRCLLLPFSTAYSSTTHETCTYALFPQ